MEPGRVIITAASAAYGERLLAWLGGLSANWPSHPRIFVYDLGLTCDTRSELVKHHIEVKKVPVFCPHWRLYFTWKLWCWNDAPADHVLWLDSGTLVLNNLDEIFDAIKELGYFAVPNYQPLTAEASHAACTGCGLPPSFAAGKPTLAGNVFGFDKGQKLGILVKKALEVAMVEEHIKATSPLHRHDQAIVSLLMHKHFDPVLLFDKGIYNSTYSPTQVPGQKIWAHRHRMRAEDLRTLRARIGRGGLKFMPQEPIPTRKQQVANLALKMLSVVHLRSKRPIYQGVRD
jgi:hypothetical protein